MRKLVFAALVVAAFAVAFAFAFAGWRNATTRTLDPSYSKGTQHITISATCPLNGTTDTKVSGSDVSFAARAEGKSGTWFQGPTSYSKSSLFVQATQAPVKGHGIRVFWASGSQNYTYC